MISTLPYFVKVSLIHCFLYLFYLIALRQLKFFRWNRTYLLSAAVLSVLIPILPFPWPLPEATPSLDVEFDILPGLFLERELGASSAVVAGKSLILSTVMLVIYLAGVLLLAIRTALGMRRLFAIVKSGSKSSVGSTPVIRIPHRESFCFFETVVLGNLAGNTVYLHELAHARQRHWLDLLLAEIFIVVFWFNPVVWLWKQSLRQVHEYLADDFVLSTGVPVESYLQVFLQSINIEKPIGPVNKFSSQSLKQRITMMTNKEIPSNKKLLYLFALPVLALAFISFAQPSPTSTVTSIDRIIVIDPAHGGEDAGARSGSGITEKDVTLEIAKLISEVGTQRGMTIVLTRSADHSLSLKDRVAVPSNRKADVFVSLHAATDANPDVKGMQIFVSEENQRFVESKRLSAVLADELGGIARVVGVKSSPAFVLKSNTAPSAIIELGYLSNQADAVFVTDRGNQRAIAEKIVNALSKF
jgi:N-acetylmuramoyl-L-alanine amidase